MSGAAGAKAGLPAHRGAGPGADPDIGPGTGSGARGDAGPGASADAADVAATLLRAGYRSLRAAETRALFDPADSALSGAGWARFAASWEDLRPDNHMADRGRYRLRRHAVFQADPDGTPVRRAPHRAHYQTLDNNRLNGGVERWFEPVEEAVGGSTALLTLIEGARAVFDAQRPDTPWVIEMHQFRILARSGEAGKPTPEGMHRDGVDGVLVLMVGRENVEGGVTGVSVDGVNAGESFTLAEPLDCVLLDDHRVWHGVTPITPLDPARPGHRDVLVLTFRQRD